MRRWIEPASRDFAEQLQVARAITISLRNPVVASATDRETKASPNGPNKRALFDLVEFDRVNQWAEQLAGDTRDVMTGALRRALELGSQRRVGQHQPITSALKANT